MSERVELTRRAFEAFNERDSLEEITTADVELVPMRAVIEGGSYRGHAGLEQFWRDTDEAWSDLSVAVEDISAAGDEVVVIGSLIGRGRDTGISVRTDLTWRIEFRNGLISRIVTMTS